MVQLDYRNDNEADERLNPASELNARETAALDQIEAGLRDDGFTGLDENNAQDQVGDKEASAAQKPNFDYEPSSGGQLNQPKLQKALAIAKKRGGVIGLLSLFGVTGGIMAAFLGPASMLINLTENFSIGNDSSSTVMERRFMKIFANATSEKNICNTGASRLKCKMGKISNNALRKMSKRGIVPLNDSGNAINTKRTGYPDKNPKSYKIDTGNGKTITVQAKDMPGFLAQKENRKIAAKVLGHTGAFNMRVKAWAGKYITNRFYSKFGIDKKGGIASAVDRKLKISERMKQFRDKIPGSQKINEVSGKITGKLNTHIGKAKRGGTGYLIAVAGCIGIKIPGYIAAGVAAVQLAQIMPYVMKIVLSPGSKAKASGVTGGFTSDDAEVAGNMLTERTPRESDGKLGSALDSPYLLYALGVSKSKPKISESFTPGFSILTNPAIKEMRNAADASAPACNVLMSPAAMYTAMAADAAVTIAASATIIGGIVKLAAGWVIGKIVEGLITKLASETVKNILTEFAKNDKIPKAKGQDLGDVIGISAAAFFSSGAMSRHIPALKASTVSAFNQIRIENEEFRREMDIASLSPFDTSSQYTFLGSILHGMRENMIKSGSYNNSFSSIVSNIFRIPSISFSFSPNVNAATNFSADYCGYAGEFELESGPDTPAINMAGLPCTGFTPGQIAMDTDTAITLLENEGWLETSAEKEIADGATIEDLISSEIIKKDNPLYDFIESCSNAETGDYLYNAAGCTVDYSKADYSLDQAVVNQHACDTKDTKDSEGNNEVICASNDLGEDSGIENPEGLKDKRSLAAISVFLIDYQMIQSVNGEDEEASTGSSPSFALGTPDDVQTQGKGWTLKPNTDYSGVQCSEGSEDLGVYEVAIASEKSKIRLCNVSYEGKSVKVASLISSNIYAMLKDAKSAGITLESRSDFRSYDDQVRLRSANGCPDLTSPSTTCRVPTAPPGKSQHERGLAVDWGWSEKPGAFCYPRATCNAGENKGYDWMVANSERYGFYKLRIEAWHFSVSGN